MTRSVRPGAVVSPVFSSVDSFSFYCFECGVDFVSELPYVLCPVCFCSDCVVFHG